MKAKTKHRPINRPERIKTDTATHLTAAEFVVRHQYCITPREVEDSINKAMKPRMSYGLGKPMIVEPPEYMPRDTRGFCGFPRDGFCGHDMPDEVTLAKINENLGGKVTPDPELEQQEEEILAERLPKDPYEHMSDDEVADKFGIPGVDMPLPKRGRPKGSKNKPKITVDLGIPVGRQ